MQQLNRNNIDKNIDTSSNDFYLYINSSIYYKNQQTLHFYKSIIIIMIKSEFMYLQTDDNDNR